MTICFELYIEGWDDVGDILYLELEVYVLLLVLFDFIDEVVVKFGF